MYLYSLNVMMKEKHTYLYTCRSMKEILKIHNSEVKQAGSRAIDGVPEGPMAGHQLPESLW
jgi:hypothetical protein